MIALGIKSEKYIAICLAFLVVVMGSTYAYYLGDTLRYPDERDYYALATNLTRSGIYALDGVHATAFRPPGYPFMLALLYAVVPSVIVMRMLNFVLLGVSIYLVRCIIRFHASPVAALAGSILVVLYPVLFYTAGTLYPQTLIATCLLGVLYVTSMKHISTYGYALVGLLAGFLVLTVPNILPILLIIFGWIWYTKKPSRLQSGFMLLWLLLIPGVWIWRNFQVFDAFVFVSSNGGYNLLLGNAEHTTPNSGVNTDISRYTAVGDKLDEIARDHYYQSQALEWIRHHKAEATQLYVFKLINHFNYRNELYTSSESSPLRDLVMLATYGSMLLLVSTRIVLAKLVPFSRFELLLLALYLAHALVSAIFFTRIRFRLPFDYLLIIMIAFLFDHVCAGVGAATRRASSRI
jgi:hypothetical protein